MAIQHQLRNVGVRVYLFCALSLAAAVPVGWLGYTQAQRWAEVAVEDADHYSSAAARSLSVQLSSAMHDSIRAIETLASQAQLAGNLDSATMLKLLRVYRNHYPEFSALYIADGKARSVALVTPDSESNGGVDYADRDYYRQLLETRRTALSRVQTGKRTRVPNIQIAAPFFSEQGELLGFAEGSLDLRRVAHEAKAVVAGLGKESRVVVLDGEGRVLADSNASNVDLKDLSKVAVFDAVKQPGGQWRVGKDEHDRVVRAVAVPMDQPMTEWRVIALKTQAVVQARAMHARWEAITVAFAAFALALVIAAAAASGLSRPIQALARLAQRVQGGDTQIEEPKRQGPREIVQLTDAVWEMIRRLGDRAQSLEALVQERTQALSQANTRREMFEIAVRHAGESIEITDAQGKYIYVNPAFERLTGYASQEVLGKGPEDVLGSSAALPSTRSHDESPQRENHSSLRKDGTAFEQQVTLSAILDQQGRTESWVGVRRDVTELRHAQEAMRLSDRMASVGALAMGVAHEINNPLACIGANLQFALESLEHSETAPPALREALGEANESAARINTVMQGLKTFSADGDRHQGLIDVNQLLESALTLVSVELRHKARVRCEFETVPLVYGSAPKLGQVFLNLLLHAAHGLPEGDATGNEIRLRTRAQGDRVMIQVTDTGKGMSREMLDRALHSPGIATSEPAMRGLSVCHDIMRMLGGEITVSSKLSLGTTFTLQLPASGARPLRTNEIGGRLVPPSLRGQVLIIDDDAHVARSLERILRPHQVRVVNNGRDGLAALRHGKYDVVLCDLMMPDLSGMDLFEAVQTELPSEAAKMIFMTGGMYTERARQFAAGCPVPVIDKPFNSAQVRQLVADYTRRAQAA